MKQRVLESLPSTYVAVESVYESTPRKPKFEIEIDDEEDDDDDNAIEENGSDFGRKNFGELASPYLTTHLYNRFLDKQYGIRKEEGRFMIGDPTMSTRAISL